MYNLTTLGSVKRYLEMKFGGVASVQVDSGGTLYDTLPDVTIIDPTGTGFVGVPVLSAGAVIDVIIVDPGYGYTSSATMAFSGGGGSGAAATVTVQANQTGNDPLLRALIAGASGFFYAKTSRRVLLADDPANPITEIRNGFSRQGQLSTLNYPITGISSLTANSLTIPFSPSFNEPGYVINEAAGSIALRGRYFGYGYSNIQIVYTAGYAADSPEAATIADAINILVATKYKRISHLDQVSQNLGGQMVASFSTKAIPPEVQCVIDLFSRAPVFG